MLLTMPSLALHLALAFVLRLPSLTDLLRLPSVLETLGSRLFTLLWLPSLKRGQSLVPQCRQQNQNQQQLSSALPRLVCANCASSCSSPLSCAQASSRLRDFGATAFRLQEAPPTRPWARPWRCYSSWRVLLVTRLCRRSLTNSVQNWPPRSRSVWSRRSRTCPVF